MLSKSAEAREQARHVPRSQPLPCLALSRARGCADRGDLLFNTVQQLLAEPQQRGYLPREGGANHVSYIPPSHPYTFNG